MLTNINEISEISGLGRFSEVGYNHGIFDVRK